MQQGDGSINRMEFLLALRKRGIGDPNVLRAMDEVPREHFVTAEFADNAYANQALPIACGQTISQPYLVAYMTAALDVRPHHRVLEVGTGSGYQAAILSRMSGDVVTIERFHTLALAASVRFETLRLNNLHVVVGDGMVPLPGERRFDRIMVTAAAEEMPQALVTQLALDGVMIIPVGEHDGIQKLKRMRKDKDGNVTTEDLMQVRFVPLLPGKAREL
ncbi:protein-L-isoaspartate(D-aspartate) O-methyltransferase [Variibacter gotjawalensis]|nr:protein-L-isoaspartate(D-aspartate) O-methyltransferase [Variibacter gotjawalensis]